MKLPLTSLAAFVKLQPGEALTRRDRNIDYMKRLTTDNLLLSHYLEAGLTSMNYKPENIHWGWDSPLSDIRGTVAGHWLSAAARIYSETKDITLKTRADFMVSEIARCQKENGGEWAFPIPEKYLNWLKRGKHTWAPQYVCHKNMMGLLDMYLYAGNEQALDILLKCADWFYRFTSDISREQMNEIMDLEETGGMMEHFANLYAVTKDERHLELMRRYERPTLFDRLYRGEDALTNMHANTTIPEVQGAARAYEVTGEERYRRIVENYWDLAVRQRGVYATGGHTDGEVWTPFGQQSARLSELNQEHCTVYNMMKLCEYLLCWTGSSEFADYYERNLYNGIFAQGYWQGRNRDTLCEPRKPQTGLISYYLPLAAGSQKKWGSETEHFWCCHCTLLQANATLHEGIYYKSSEDLMVCQYLPSKLSTLLNDTNVEVEQHFDGQSKELVRPNNVQVLFNINSNDPVEFTLKLRKPWWLKAELKCLVNGQEVPFEDDNGFACIHRTWYKDEVRVILTQGLTCYPLLGQENMVAFMNGPVVLAGLTSEERTLFGDKDNPSTILTPDAEREWQSWKNGWRTQDQPVGLRFKPLYEIGNEIYTVYFPIKKI